MRVPEYGWTTQKVFHLMNFIVNGGDILNFGDIRSLEYTLSFGYNFTLWLCLSYVAVRAIVFGFHTQVFYLHPKVSLLTFRAMLFWNFNF